MALTSHQLAWKLLEMEDLPIIREDSDLGVEAIIHPHEVEVIGNLAYAPGDDRGKRAARTWARGKASYRAIILE